jgi:hypothetical protein
MDKNFLKGFTMLLLVVALALAAAAVSAKAQSTGKVVANVPFEFSVGYKIMPAGEYSVQVITTSNGLMIQSADGKNSAVRLADLTDRAKAKSPARLVFHRYGERYFLAEVWSGADNTGRLLTKCQEERAIEGELTIAANENAHASNTPYETVEVPAVLR